MNIETIKNHESPERPWYLEPWVWLVIGLPLASVVGGITTLFIAISEPPDLVPGHWKKDGKAIVQLFEAEQASIDMKLNATTKFLGNNVVITLNQPVEDTALQVHFIHPTRGENDQVTTLHKIGVNEYSGILPPLVDGNYRVVLDSDPQTAAKPWRLTASVVWPTEQLDFIP